MDPAHLQAYLNEFVFRFNRRHSRSRGMVFYRVLELAAGHDPVRYARHPCRQEAARHGRRSSGAPATRPAWTAPPPPGPGEPLKCNFSFHSG